LSRNQRLGDLPEEMVCVTTRDDDSDEDKELFICPEGITRVPFTLCKPNLHKSSLKRSVYTSLSSLPAGSSPLTLENLTISKQSQQPSYHKLGQTNYKPVLPYSDPIISPEKSASNISNPTGSPRGVKRLKSGREVKAVEDTTVTPLNSPKEV
jgi:hypothetical protein